MQRCGGRAIRSALCISTEGSVAASPSIGTVIISAPCRRTTGHTHLAAPPPLPPSSSGGDWTEEASGIGPRQANCAAVFDAVVAPPSFVVQATTMLHTSLVVVIECVCGGMGCRVAAAGKRRAAALHPVGGSRCTSPEEGQVAGVACADIPPYWARANGSHEGGGGRGQEAAPQTLYALGDGLPDHAGGGYLGYFQDGVDFEGGCVAAFCVCLLSVGAALVDRVRGRRWSGRRRTRGTPRRFSVRSARMVGGRRWRDLAPCSSLGRAPEIRPFTDWARPSARGGRWRHRSNGQQQGVTAPLLAKDSGGDGRRREGLARPHQLSGQRASPVPSGQSFGGLEWPLAASGAHWSGGLGLGTVGRGTEVRRKDLKLPRRMRSRRRRGQPRAASADEGREAVAGRHRRRHRGREVEPRRRRFKAGAIQLGIGTLTAFCGCRIGEAANPGPGAAPSDGRRVEEGRAVEEMAAAAVFCHQTWSGWADSLRARASARRVGLGTTRLDVAVDGAAQRATAAALRLAEARARFDAFRRDDCDDAGGDGAAGVPAAGRRRHDKGGTADRDPEADEDGDTEAAKLKRRLRSITDFVHEVVRTGRPNGQDMAALRGLVQEAANDVARGRACHGTTTGPETPQAAGSSSSGLVLGAGGSASSEREPRHAAVDDLHNGTAGEERQAPLVRRPGARRHRRGSGAASRPEVLKVFYANTSSFSAKAEQFMLGLEADIWFAAEAHLRGADLETAVRRISGQGWGVSFSEAAQSDSSERGTWGGVVAGARRHLGVQPLIHDTRRYGGFQSRRQDLVGMNVALRGGELLILGGYAREGRYLSQLAEVARLTENGRRPFVWLADWNVPPEALEEEPALAALGAVVVRPQGGSASCHQGGGTLIDYAVASRAALPYISLALERRVPWSPHDGLRLSVLKAASGIKVRRCRRPAAWSTLLGTEGSGPPRELPWVEAMAKAEADLGEVDLGAVASLESQRKLMEDVGALPQALSMGRRLMIWARASELQELAAKGIDAGTMAAKRVLGRAMPPKFSEAPLIAHRLTGPQRLPGGYSEAARLWGTLRAVASRLKTAMQAGHLGRQDSCRVELIAIACGWRKGARRCWREVEQGADDAAGRLAVARACEPRATVDTVEAAIGTFGRLEEEAVRIGKAEANRRWHAWVARALANGGGAAHRWANAPNAPTFDVTAPGAFQPAQVVAHHTAQWSSTWMSDDVQACARAVQAAKEVRRRALAARGQARPRTFSAEDILAAAKRFRRGTAIGTDGQEFTGIVGASEESRAELGDIASEAVRHLAWPVQVLLTVLKLLGKKQGGSRAIAVIASFARLLMNLLKEEVRDWDRAVGSTDDSALAGRRPLDETARRVLRTEVAGLTGKHVIMLLWDMAKFYDTLDPSVLAELAMTAGFPLDQLALGLSLHRAPRLLRIDGCDGEVVSSSGRSVLAGCTLSTSFARAYIRPLREEVGSTPQCRLSQHVDDLTQVITAPSRQLAVARAVRHGRALAEAAARLRLTIADKSRVVASAPSAARDVATALRGGDVHIGAARAAEDLGVSTAGGKRRCVGSFAKRLIRAARRGARVKRLASANGGAQRLYKTGTDPQQAYEAEVHGAAPPQVSKMRQNARVCVVPAGTHSCTTTLLAWRLGPRCDPAVVAPVRQAKLWQRLWHSSTPREKKEITKAWQHGHPRVLLHGVKWGRVSGPLQATVAALGQLGWAPVAPNHWLAPDRATMADLDDASPSADAQIAEAIEASAADAVWKASASHYLGAGLDEGEPSLRPAKDARKKLVDGRKPAFVKALDAVVCGGFWHSGRDRLAKQCRCGSNDDAFHHYWGCELLKGMAESDGYEIIGRTQWLAEEWVGEIRRYECLWGRAIVPKSLCDPGPPLTLTNTRRVQAPEFPAVAGESRTIYTDGSGGPNHAPKGAPAAGSGLAAVAWDDASGRQPPVVRNVSIAAAAVPGKQTVPRAELWAAAWATELGSDEKAEEGPGYALDVRADAAYVVNGFASTVSQAKLARGRNGDLWERLKQGVEARTGTVTISKVKAHLSPTDMFSDHRLSIADFLGNHLADACAGAAAACTLQDNVAARTVERWERRAYLVALRLAAIEAWHWENGAPTLYPKPEPLPAWEPTEVYRARQQLHQEVRDQGHALRVENGRAVCGRCHKRRACSNVRFWTKNPCRPLSTGWVVHQGGALAGKRPGDALAEGRAEGVDGVGQQPAATRRRADVGTTGEEAADIGGDMAASARHRRADVDAPHISDLGGVLPDPAADVEIAESDEDVFGFGGSLDQAPDNPPGDTRLEGSSHGEEHGGGLVPVGAVGVSQPKHGADTPLDAERAKRIRHEDHGTSSGGQAGGGTSSSSSGSGLPREQDGYQSQLADPALHDRHDGAPQRSGTASPMDGPFVAGMSDVAVVRRRITGKRTPTAAGIVLPSPTVPGGSDIDGSEGDLVSARTRRRLIQEQQLEIRRRRLADAECMRQAWGEAEPAVAISAFVQIPPTDRPPPFDVGQGHDLVACGGFYGCVRCGAVVGWHGHQRLALPCRGSCPVGSRGPVRLLVRGRLPHRQQEHYGRDWPSGESSPVPFRVRLGQSRPGDPTRAAA